MNATRPATREVPTTRSPRLGRILTIVIAVGVALIVWGIGRLLVGHELTVTGSGANTATVVGPAAVIVASLAGGLLGWVTATLVERLTSKAGIVWLVLATVVLAISLAGPITQSIDGNTTIALLVLHLSVGAVLITGLRRTIPTDRPDVTFRSGATT